MKPIVLALAAFSYATTIAQTTSGTVVYQETIHMQKPEGISGPEAAMLEKMLPKELKNEKILRFTPAASLYAAPAKAAAATDYEDRSEGGMVMRVNVVGNGADKCFTDLQTGKQTRQTEFMGRTFLISSDREKGWKMTGRQKVLLGHPCAEAVLDKDSSKTIAWFASDIPVSTGPAAWSGLPGLVLEVDADNGRMNIVATSITAGEIAAADLVAPRQGKKVTQEEYRRIVDEKRAEMGAQGSGNMIRVIRQD